MPLEMPKTLKRYGKVVQRGLLAQMAPEIAKGMLVEILRLKQTDVPKAITWVETNASLWNDLDPKYQKRMRELGHHVTDLSWMTFDWAINALKEDYPALASLFLGWKKAGNWLARQVEQIKKEILNE